MREERYGFSEEGFGFAKEFQGRRLVFLRPGSAPELKPWLDLLNELWGFSDPDRIPLHEVVVAVMTGGLFLGIEFGGEPAGLVYVLPAHTREWGYHHHSNFMGFRPEYRSLGLGFEAKRVHAILAVREGVELVTWTFDPLQAANASLNFRKLGGLCRTCLPDLYGAMGGNFDPGLPTDRFLVEWRLLSARVKDRLRGRVPSVADVQKQYGFAALIEEAAEAQAVKLAAVRVRIPPGLPELAGRDRDQARARLREFRDLMSGLFNAGYAVTNLVPGREPEPSYYLLERGV